MGADVAERTGIVVAPESLFGEVRAAPENGRAEGDRLRERQVLVGMERVVVDENADLDDLTHLIVPGVGHFRAVMQHLEALGWPDKVRAFAASGRPTLGICVGMQLLATRGMEGEETPGLGLVKALVDRLPEGNDMLRLPHMGWNSVALRRKHPVLDGIKPNRDFYFVHTYHLVCDDPADVLTLTEHGHPFVSAIRHANIWGTQFHPEKSHKFGLALMRNFIAHP